MPTGLIRRGARYSIRRRVPLDLVQHYGGKAEITQALGTADPKIARKLMPFKWAALEREFDALRVSIASNPAPATLPPPRKAKAAPKVKDRWETMSREEFDYQQEAEAFFREQDAQEEGERDEREELERKILRFVDGPPEGLTPEQLAIRDLMRDRAYYREVAEEQAANARSELKRAQAALQAQAAPAAEAKLTVSPAPASGAATSLDAIVDKWAAERKVSAKGVDTHRAVARWFTARTGDLPVEKITKRDVLTFKDKLLAEGTTAANVKVKLTRLRTLLNYAASNDYIPENPAKDVTLVVPDAEKNKRKPFDLPSLAAIFGSPVYAQDERPTEGRGEAAYWLPLLALFTGARLEELGQLRPSDVREETYPDADEEEQKAWFIHVMEDEEDDLKLKNAGSERIIPVHPSLEQQGFIRFVQAAKDAGQARLFPALRPNKYGRLTAKWGEWFGGYKRNVIGITDGRLVFHSFRHTFKRYARHVKMVEGVQRQIMGHSGKDAADDYGDGYTLHQLVEGMRQYKVPGFKLPPLPPAFRSAGSA
jgi:integrase